MAALFFGEEFDAVVVEVSLGCLIGWEIMEGCALLWGGL